MEEEEDLPELAKAAAVGAVWTACAPQPRPSWSVANLAPAEAAAEAAGHTLQAAQLEASAPEGRLAPHDRPTGAAPAAAVGATVRVDLSVTTADDGAFVVAVAPVVVEPPAPPPNFGGSAAAAAALRGAAATAPGASAGTPLPRGLAGSSRAQAAFARAADTTPKTVEERAGKLAQKQGWKMRPSVQPSATTTEAAPAAEPAVEAPKPPPPKPKENVAPPPKQKPEAPPAKAAKATEAGAVDAEKVAKAVRGVLRGFAKKNIDLATVSTKQIRAKVGEKLGGADTAPWKEQIKAAAVEFLSRA